MLGLMVPAFVQIVPMLCLTVLALVLIAVLVVAGRALWRRDMVRRSLGTAIAAWAALSGLTWLVGWEDGRWWWFFAAPAALGLATGLARPVLPSLPLASAATVITVYLALMLAANMWAVQCWDCAADAEYESLARKVYFGFAVFWAGVVLACTLIGIGFGALVTRYLPAATETSPR